MDSETLPVTGAPPQIDLDLDAEPILATTPSGPVDGVDGADGILRPFPDRNRVRSARALANDEKLRDAALELIVESGWESLALQTVATRAGLTVGAIYARAENKSELGIDLWRSRCLPALIAGLTDLGPTLRGPVTAYRGVLGHWFEPAPALAGALDLAVSARFDQDLGDVVLDDILVLARELRAASFPDAATDPARSRLHLALGAAFLSLSGTRFPIPAVQPLERALSAPTAIDSPVLVDDVPNDPEALAMLDAARDVLVRVGHRRATAARIARAAGVMTSTLFARFPTKAVLFAAAIGGRRIDGGLALELERLGRSERAIADWAADSPPAARVHVLGRGLATILRIAG